MIILLMIIETRLPLGLSGKNPPGVQETRVLPLDREDPLEDMAAHSSFLAWRIPWPEKPGGYSAYGHKSQEL